MLQQQLVVVAAAVVVAVAAVVKLLQLMTLSTCLEASFWSGSRQQLT